MHYASLELTLELEQLSGWKRDDPNGFTLGFLIRKLPEWAQISKNSPKAELKYTAFNTSLEGKIKAIQSGDEFSLEQDGDTPEDAACKLCLELIRQNILEINV